ncbi:MAG: polymorphic toxin-type HINT domain-containing protein [Acutalibacteraceae bacterium]
MYEKRGDLQFHYRYDVNGNLASIMRVNAAGSTYTAYVICNSRGDVEELRKTDGTVYARYIYDSWGNVLHILDADGNEVTSLNTLAVQNPFRYRGYYYDSESGLYYLQSRYYDPVTGRFLNADGQLAGVGGEVNGYNLYAYCFNNPVNASDSEGEWPNWRKLASGITTAVVGMVAVAAVATAAACASPIVAAVTVVAGIASMAIGASEIEESFNGKNYVRDKVFRGNKRAYNAAKFVTTTVASMGTRSVATAVCFIAGTTVLTLWSNKKIEDVKSGDYVYSTNPETGEMTLKRVVQTFVNETNELVHVYVNGEEIVTTPEHPFYVSNCGWVGAIDLKAGDKLVLVNGEYVVVEQIQHEILEQSVKVYNFEVEDFHTYYVSGTGVLVHNVCVKGQAKKVDPVKFESSNSLSPGTFHRSIKPNILNKVKPNYTVGKNPDILLDKANNIAYQGANGRGFQDTGLNMIDILKEIR